MRHLFIEIMNACSPNQSAAEASELRVNDIEIALLRERFVSIDGRGGMEDDRAMRIAPHAAKIMDEHYESLLEERKRREVSRRMA